MNLSLKQKLLLFLNGRCFLRYEKREGWHGYLPVYAVKCERHGLVENHPHGNGGIKCPACLAEWVKQSQENKQPKESEFLLNTDWLKFLG